MYNESTACTMCPCPEFIGVREIIRPPLGASDLGEGGPDNGDFAPVSCQRDGCGHVLQVHDRSQIDNPPDL